MNMQKSARDIYDTLLALEADIAALGEIEGIAETAEYRSLLKSQHAHHEVLNVARKLVARDWSVFLAFIDRADDVAAFSGGTNKDDNNPPPPPGGGG